MKRIPLVLAVMLCGCAGAPGRQAATSKASDAAPAQTLETLRSLSASLSMTQQVRLTFIDSDKHRAGYFVRYSTTYDTIAISPSAPGFLQSYPTEYPLKELTDITVLTEASQPSAHISALAPEGSLVLDCGHAGESPRRVNAGPVGSSFDFQSARGGVHCTFVTAGLDCQLPGGDHLSFSRPASGASPLRINDCSITYTK